MTWSKNSTPVHKNIKHNVPPTVFFPQEDVFSEVREEGVELWAEHAESLRELNSSPDADFSRWWFIQMHGKRHFVAEIWV